MDAPSLFDSRLTDPSTSDAAAERVRPGRSALIEAIRDVLAPTWSPYKQPLTAFEIAERVEQVFPRRWDEGSIRSAISRAGLRAVDNKGVSPRGSRCLRFSL